MMRRRSTGRVDEVAFADVAMAILGPIVLIMTISLVIAARTAAQTECEVLDEAAVTEGALQLTDWVGRIGGEIAARRELMQRQCGHRSRPVEGRLDGDSVPLPVAGLCQGSRDAVLAGAGMDLDGLRRLVADRDLVNAEMALCAGRTPDAPCRSLASADVAAYVDEIRQFRDALVDDTRRLHTMASARCGLSGSDRVEPASVLILPQSLTGLCPVELDKLMASAGVSRQALLRQVALRDDALKTVQACVAMLPQGHCETLSDSGVNTAVGALKGWYGQADEEVQAYGKWIDLNCPQSVVETPAEPSFRPPPLAGLCYPDAVRVLSHSGIDLAALRTIEGRRRARSALLVTCAARQPETIDERERQFEFKQCSTTPKIPDAAPEQDMPRSDVATQFDELAQRLAKKLADGAYNRVDILGHTDDWRVGDRGCAENGARNNVQLSFVRAEWFRNGLIDAFQRAPNRYGDIVARLNARTLRIYAIGVGPQEPLPRELGEEDADYRKRNRRIELRLVQDRRPGDGR